MNGDTAGAKQFGQTGLYILRFPAAPYANRQAFAGKLIKDVQGAKRAAIMGAIGHKVIAPHMARIFGS